MVEQRLPSRYVEQVQTIDVCISTTCPSQRTMYQTRLITRWIIPSLGRIDAEPTLADLRERVYREYITPNHGILVLTT